MAVTRINFPEFMKHFNDLGYKGDIEGICNGLSVELMLTLLADLADENFNDNFPETEICISRLIEIEKNPNLKKMIDAERKKRNPLEKDHNLLEMPALCEALEIAQNTWLYYSFYNRGFSQSNIIDILPYIYPSKIEQAGGVIRSYTETVFGDKEKLIDFFENLARRLTGYKVFLIGSKDHIMSLLFSEQGWLLFTFKDGQEICSNLLSTNELVDEVMYCFEENMKSGFNISLYTTRNKDDKTLRRKLNNLKKNNLSQIKKIDLMEESDLGTTSIKMAIRDGDAARMEREINLGVDINTRIDETHKTLLMYAICSNQVEMITFLIKRGADIYLKDKEGNLSIHDASRSGNLKVVKALFKQHATLEQDKKTLANVPNNEGETPLYIAARYGFVDVINYLIKQGANVNAATRMGDTPLLIAAANNHHDTVKLICERNKILNKNIKALVNIPNHYGHTAFAMAASNGAVHTMKYLIEQGADMNASNKRNNSPLHLAAKEGHVDAVKLIFEQNKLLNNDNSDWVNMPNKLGFTPLHFAVSKGPVELVLYLLDQNADITKMTKTLDSPLHFAAAYGNEEAARLLIAKYIEKDLSLDEENELGQTPFWMAAQGNHIGVMKLLFAHGIDMYKADKRMYTPLHVAASRGNLNAIKLFCEYNACHKNNDAFVNQSIALGNTPLHLAAFHADDEVITYLIDQGADITKLSTLENLPLHHAAVHGNEKAMRILVEKHLENGLSLDNENIYGQTAFWLAAQGGHTKVMALLLQHNIDCMQKDEKGQTPLFMAAKNGHMNAVKLIIKKLKQNKERYKINEKNEKGQTPLMMAVKNKNIEMVRLLIEKGACVNDMDKKYRTPFDYAEGDKALENELDATHPLFKLVYMGKRNDIEAYLSTLPHEQIVELLNRPVDKRTLLSIAVEKGHHQIVHLLLSHNVDIDISDNELAVTNSGCLVEILLFAHQTDTLFLSIKKNPQEMAEAFGRHMQAIKNSEHKLKVFKSIITQGNALGVYFHSSHETLHHISIVLKHIIQADKKLQKKINSDPKLQQKLNSFFADLQNRFKPHDLTQKSSSSKEDPVFKNNTHVMYPAATVKPAPSVLKETFLRQDNLGMFK